MFSLDFRAHSETGLVRKNNQDSCHASPNALVVADGMGGAAAGDLASAIAIHEISRADRRLEGDEMLVAFSGAISHANDLIADLVAGEPSLDGMGTTVCGAFFSGTQLGMAHIGDSRAYLMRDGRLTQLSHDHSWVQSLVDEGRLHEDDMSTHPHRSLLLRVLNGQAASEPDTDLLDAQLDDRLLFCSDGLSGFTTTAELKRVLALPDLDDVVPALIKAAHAGGGADNITFVVADVVPHSDELDARAAVDLGAVTDGDLAEMLATATQTPMMPSRPTVVPVSSRGAHARPLSRRSASGGGAAPDAGGIDDPDDELDDDLDEDDHEHGPHGSRGASDAEALRYQPTHRRGRWLPTVALLAAVVVLVAGAGIGGLLYSRSQYYVGAAPTTNGESVAIFRGLPDDVLGLKLSSVQQVQPTLVRDLPSYYRQQVQSTISADSFSDAEQTTQQLSTLAQQCVALRASATASQNASAAAASRASAASASRSRASASASKAGKPGGKPTPAKPSTPVKPSASHSSPAHPSSTAPATPSASSSASIPTGTASGAPSTTGLTLQDCS